MKSIVILVASLLALPIFVGIPAGLATAQISPNIVNGEPEFAEPTTAALLQGLDPPTALVVCSATLIGCDTAITTGHCFNTGASLRRTLFFQHAGFYEIESATRHPVYAAYYDQGIGDFYEVTRQEDIALIKLVTPVSGITPSPINSTQTPGPGTSGRVVGFGRDPLNEVSIFQQNAGMKRSGWMTLAACQDPTLSPWDVLCWDPSEVIGAPGEDVTTCNVDSGGPLFVDQAGVRVVAGLTKGAIQAGGSCIPPVEAYDTNVYRHHQWIEQTVAQLGAVDLSVTNCGSLPQVEPDAQAEVCNGVSWFEDEPPRVCGFQGELSSSLPQQQHSFQVPADTQLLRVNMNGISRTTNPVDVSLYVRAGAPPTTSVYDCAGVATGNFAVCEFDQPQAGTWYALAVRVTGTVEYQITATEFAAPVPDQDQDGVEDPADNCLVVPNADQIDTNGEGFGNMCDADYDNDGSVSGGDIAAIASQFGYTTATPGFNPDYDRNSDGIITVGDIAYASSRFGLAPGPSGLACAGTPPCP